MSEIFKVAITSQRMIQFPSIKVFNTFPGSKIHLHKKLKEYWLEFLQDRYDLVPRL